MTEENRLAFVFISGRRPSDLHEDFSATFKASLPHNLWVLEKENAVDLIRLAEKYGSLRYTDAAVEHILKLTNGHPYLTQLFCQRLWEQAYIYGHTNSIPIVNVDDVQATIHQVVQLSDNALDWLWKGLQPAERIYAAALAQITTEDTQTSQIITEDQVVSVLSTYAERLRTLDIELAPQDLVKRQVIEQVQTDGQPDEHIKRKYRFAVELFRLWVKEKQSLQRVKDDLDRTDKQTNRILDVALGYYRQNNWELASRSFHDVLKRNPDHLRARLYLGETMLELGDIQRATKAFRYAQTLDREASRLPLARTLVLVLDTVV